MENQEQGVEPQAAGLSSVKRRLLQKFLSNRTAVSEPLAAPILPRPAGEPVPMAFSQQQVWLHSQMAGDVPFYNETITIYRHGPLDASVLEKCLTEIVRRHEIWRTTFEVVDGEPVQIVHPAPDRFSLQTADLRGLPDEMRESEAKRLATLDARQPFDLQRLPLIRGLLVRTEDEQYRLYVAVHQIVFDAVTAYRVFVPELSALYEAFLAGRPSPLPDLSIQYADYAFAQRRLPAPNLQKQEAYWKKHLAGELPVLAWPNDRPRPPVNSHRGVIQRYELPTDLVEKVRRLGQRYGVSSYMTLLAGMAALLYRYTGQEEMILGGFTAGRRRAELEPLIGYFVNLLPLRIDLSGRPSFSELLARVRGVVLDALAHEEIPFVQVVQAVQARSDPSRNPLFQIALSQQPRMPEIAPGWELVPEEIGSGGSKIDLIVVIDERGDQIAGPITYNPDLLDSATITRMVGHWQTLLAGVDADPEMRLSDAPLLTPAEREQLAQWNNTRRDYPADTCLHELIERQAARTPDAVAAMFEQESIHYRELNARANQLAHYLRKLGVGPETLVGISMERSIDMVIALLAIMKAGGAYVPIDPAYPKERTAFMIEDSGLRFLIIGQSQDFDPVNFGGELICLNRDWRTIAQESVANPAVLVKPENLVYLIYTSGSTGRPKGVQIPHRALVNLLASVQQFPGLTQRDSLLAVTTISFDIAALELYLPLIVGARCVLASREAAADGLQLWRLMEAHEITAIQATPSTFRLLLESGWPGSSDLKILCGGEAWSAELAAELIRHSSSVWNMYGPTETTVWSAVHPVRSGEGPVLIGRPIANTEMYLLDANLQPAPVGVVGELYIGGDGLARGYYKRPDLDAEKFIAGPFDFEVRGRLYRTGDLARYHADGNIECLGRVDNQVKVRGFRIELGEIESVLREHPVVFDACAVVREDEAGGPRLVAYVVLARQPNVSLDPVRDFLKQRLPVYMMPALYALDVLPLTPNGKVDRNALPDPGELQIENAAGEQKIHESDEQEPGSWADIHDPVEQLVATIWTDILKVQRISLYDNFFDLGGHSMLATQMVARLEKELGLRMKPKELAFQTLGQFAASCRERLQCQ